MEKFLHFPVKMEFRNITGLLLVSIGILMSVLSLGNIIRGRDIINSAILLVLGCILMVLGAVLKHYVEFDAMRKRIEDEEKELKHETGEIRKLGGGGNGGISKWKIRDLEYKVQKLESEMEKKEGSE